MDLAEFGFHTGNLSDDLRNADLSEDHARLIAYRGIIKL